MHLKSITIEGFKSYGSRTVIEGFDPYFNAITGLNGSGKSNVLDSICFVLGISNLSQVRATSLQELIYKNGQAGITKASVSITFDNCDKPRSPVGYDQYDEITVTRQIVLGGQNKYLINGCTATNARVKDLFQSVQLNVNNPHFLIMQGRITKVLNMKPIEILSMIEEAAGTKMYEAKKQASQRTIETKESKLREVNSMLDEVITPTLTKLKEERTAYLEYQKIQRELEHLTKLNVAYQYVSAQELSQKSKHELIKLADKIKELQMQIASLKDQSQALEKSISEMRQRKSKDVKDALTSFEKKLTEMEKNEARIATAIKNKKGNLDNEVKKIANLNQQKSEESASIANKEKGLNKLMTELEKLQQVSTKDAEAVTAAEHRYQAASSGLSSNADGQETTLADQLMTAKADIATAETEMKQAELTLKHSTSELKNKEAGLAETAKAYEKDQAAFKPLKKAIEKIENDIRILGYEEGKLEELTEKRRNLQNGVNTLKNNYDTLLAKFPQLSFNYTNPSPNFDRSRVKGLLCELFTVKDPAMATALEVAAGGKLYNVVVDNEETGKLLLQKGNLPRRHTFIPLNKIQGQPVATRILRTAENLVGKDNVCDPLSLIDFPPYLKPAMEFAFGNVLICKDSRLAQTVAFDKRIQKRTITLDGDVYNPAGTLTGGSRKPGKPFLAMLIEIRQHENELNELQTELNTVNQQLKNIDAVSKKFNELKQEWDIKKREAELMNERLKQTTHHQRLQEVESLRETIQQQQETVKRSKETINRATKKAKELENMIKNFQSVREKELREAEKHMNGCKKQAETSDQLMKNKQQEVDMVKLELEDLKEGVNNYDEQVKAVKQVIAGFEEELQQLNASLNDAQAAVKVIWDTVTEQRAILKACEEEINSLQEQYDGVNKEIEGSKLHIKELENQASKWSSTSSDVTNKIEDLLARHDWINEEKKYFGKGGTAYDFTINDPRDVRDQLKKLNEKKEELSKNVSTRAMTMLDKTEEQYNDLLQKKEIVENDKLTIAAVIKELDEKKKEVLQTAWVQVNKDFGSIFSILLPGTQAKLVPPDGKTVLDGLEVKVAFGNKWKESLNELSGGQRSLVALSLILSILRFKPAPIYILDEVDAALDLSHTHNIGNMLRTHFKHSQFIVVSLKDGMFSNANVLFKTKFVDGMSTVTRHTQSQKQHSKHS